MGPMANMTEQCFPFPVREEIYSDNTSALNAVRSGVSRKLSHLRRTQRVNIRLV